MYYKTFEIYKNYNNLPDFSKVIIKRLRKVFMGKHHRCNASEWCSKL